MLIQQTSTLIHALLSARGFGKTAILAAAALCQLGVSACAADWIQNHLFSSLPQGLKHAGGNCLISPVTYEGWLWSLTGLIEGDEKD